jgi:hypothetical protein
MPAVASRRPPSKCISARKVRLIGAKSSPFGGPPARRANACQN